MLSGNPTSPTSPYPTNSAPPPWKPRTVPSRGTLIVLRVLSRRWDLCSPPAGLVLRAGSVWWRGVPPPVPLLRQPQAQAMRLVVRSHGLL